MPSLRAKLLNRYIRLRLKPLPLHEIESERLRRRFERMALPMYARGVSREWVAAPVRGEWQRPSKITSPATILYLHGGAYVFCSVRTHRPLTTGLAAAAGSELFSLEYRLAPEHRCPAAIEDALAAYFWLLGQGREPDRIVLAGDSAGGALALALLQALKAKEKPLPAGAILYSPWTDLAATGESVAKNAARDAMFRRDSAEQGGERYAGRLDRQDPRVSPLYGDFEGLPPLLVYASSSEMLFDDSTRLVEKAIKAGVSVSFRPHDDIVHAWPIFHPLIPEAEATVAESAEHVRKWTERAGAKGREAA